MPNDLQQMYDRLIDALESPNMADWITAIAAVLTFVVALVALLYAREQINEAAQARELTKELEVERAQPYVVVYSEPSGATMAIVDLVIKNYGATAARDVRVKIDPWPVRTTGSPEGERVGIPDIIPVLAPGQEWRAMWDNGVQRRDSEHPDRHEGVVTYLGIEDAERSSPIVLDWSIYSSRRWVVMYGEHDSAKALREIQKTMGKWSEGVRGGLAVYSRDGDAKDERSRAEQEAWLEDHAESPVAPTSAEPVSAPEGDLIEEEQAARTVVEDGEAPAPEPEKPDRPVV